MSWQLQLLSTRVTGHPAGHNPLPSTTAFGPALSSAWLHLTMKHLMTTQGSVFNSLRPLHPSSAPFSWPCVPSLCLTLLWKPHHLVHCLILLCPNSLLIIICLQPRHTPVTVVVSHCTICRSVETPSVFVTPCTPCTHGPLSPLILPTKTSLPCTAHEKLLATSMHRPSSRSSIYSPPQHSFYRVSYRHAIMMSRIVQQTLYAHIHTLHVLHSLLHCDCTVQHRTPLHTRRTTRCKPLPLRCYSIAFVPHSAEPSLLSRKTNTAVMENKHAARQHLLLAELVSPDGTAQVQSLLSSLAGHRC